MEDDFLRNCRWLPFQQSTERFLSPGYSFTDRLWTVLLLGFLCATKFIQWRPFVDFDLLYVKVGFFGGFRCGVPLFIVMLVVY